MKKKMTLLLALVLAATIALSACQGDKNAQNSANPNTSQEATPSTDPNFKPTTGGRLVWGMTQDLVSLDPHQSTDAGTRSVVFNMYEGLVKPTSTGDLVPAVASDYVISPEATEYTFTLREGITFHDGSLVTVEDIKYSIERYAEIQGESSAFSSLLDKVEIMDETTVKITLTEGYSEFLADLTLAIIPANNADPASNPVGTGPYKYESYTLGQNLELVRYEGYWKENGAYLDSVQFKFIADLSTAYTELQAGTIDVLNYLTAAQAQNLVDTQSSNFTIVEGSMNLVQAMFLNNEYEPFKKLEVRQAMIHAVNAQEVNGFLFNGKSKMIGSHMITTLSKWYEPAAENMYPYSIETAKQLLADAGYPDGFELEITVPSSYTQHVDTAQIIVDQLSKVGIKATINKVEWSTWLEDTYRGRNFQATIIGFDGTLAPSDWLKKYTSTASNNLINYNNAEYDQLFADALATVDDAKKIELYKKLQMNLAENAASVYIQEPADFVAVSSKFAGYEFYPTAAWDASTLYQVK